MSLHVLSHVPQNPTLAPPVLLVHGAFTNAECWSHFLEDFEQHGIEVHALSLRGHGKSGGLLDASGVFEYVSDIRHVAKQLSRPPVLVGHSMGGYLVQLYARMYPLESMVLMASLPPWGLGAVLGALAWRNPEDWWRFLQYSWQPSSLEPEDSAWKIVLGTAPDSRWVKRWEPQRESLRSAWELSIPLLPFPLRPPKTLVLGATGDRLIAPSVVQATAAYYDAQLEWFEIQGHAMMLDREWRQVSAVLRAWVMPTGSA
jgi:pimeloyl-ACP methyl ester carboxylesterase